MPANEKNGLIVRTAMLYLLMLAYGVSTTFLGTVLMQLIDEFSVPVAEGGVFNAVMNLGCLVGVFASGPLIERFRLRNLLGATFLVFACILLLVGVSGTLVAFLVVIGALGLAQKLFDAVINAAVAREYTRNSGFFMNLLHCSFGIGSFLGPLLAGTLVEKGISWRVPFVSLGVACLALLLVYWLLTRDAGQSRTAVRDRAPAAGYASILTPRMIVAWFLLAFYCGHQIGMNNWLPIFLSSEFGTDTVTAGVGLSLFWLGLIVSRLAASILTRRYCERDLLIAGSALGAVLMLAGVWIGAEATAFLAAGAAGLFTGATIPMTLTLAYRWHPEAHGKVTMLLFIAVAAGGGLFPWIMGLAADSLGLKSTMYLNGILLLATFVLCLCIPRESGPETVRERA